MAHHAPIHFLWHILAIPLMAAYVSASQETINCTNVVCPSMADVPCPSDSFLRELNKPFILESDDLDIDIPDELFDVCCLAAKCGCHTCHIPDCNASTVVYEATGETQIPGRCCGTYDCIREPNCTLVRDTPGQWLTDCQRCECVSGERICHRSCDEIPLNPTTSFCKSKNLNRFFAPGDTWKDGCADCECINGEEKCLMPFCKRVECTHKKQLLVTLDGHCCPICYPDVSAWKPIEETPEEVPPMVVQVQTTPAQPPPCGTREPPLTYSVYTEAVEVASDSSDTFYLYGAIFILLTLLTTITCKYIHLRNKYRSYDGGSITSKKYSPVPVEVAK